MTRLYADARMLAIRADANARIGAGHVMRCIALAEAWRRAGGDAELFSVAPSPLVCRAAERRDIRVHSYGAAVDAFDALIAWVRERTDAWVALDGYDIGLDAQRSVRAAGARLLVLDDAAAGAEFDCDIVLNQSIGAESLGYRVAAGTRCCFGPQYALVRSEFAQRAPMRRFDAPAFRVVVTFGGADVHNQAARVARILSAAAPPVDATIVTGQAHASAIDLPAAPGVAIGWEAPTDDIASVLGQADLAICGAGGTCWELAHLGVPALTLVVADNQLRVAAGLHDAGVVRSLGWFDAVSDDELATAIDALRRDSAARGEMSRRGRALVDGRGADRVVDAMRLAAVEA